MKILMSIALGLAVLCGPVMAQKPAATKKPAAVTAALKTADAVLTASAKAMGSAASDKVTTSVAKAKMSIPANGLNGEMEMMVSKERFFMKQTLPGIGDILMGFDGKNGWAKDPINGLRDLEGAELAQAKDEVKNQKSSDWKQRYKKAELLGVRKVGVAQAYAVRLTPKTGAPQTHYFDTKTLFLVRTDMVAVGPTGKIPTETYLSDYRLLDGMQIPFKTRSIVSGIQEVIITYTDVKNNVPVDETLFNKPKADPKK
jgi:outer membrane lipoprotein-sorting protein